MKTPRRSAPISWLLGLRFHSVVLLTIVPGLIVPGLFVASLLDFYKLNVSLTEPARRVATDGNAVQTYFDYKLQSFPRLLTHNQRAETISAERRWANDELHLDIPGETWDALLSHLPGRIDETREMNLWNGGQLLNAKFRFRGDSGFHWLLPKKSFKLKMDKGELFRGHRELNFTVKYPYMGVLVSRIAKDFDLLAPGGDPVKTFLNNQFYGVHRFLENVDEGFLRNNRRMPGNVYKGEGLRATGDWHAGLLPYFLLYSPYVWPKIAIDNSLPDNNRDDLARFSRLLALPEHSAQFEFRDQFDLETVARNIAFNFFVNEWHSGDGNNLRWYVDPTDGKFYPIIWDGYAGSNAQAFSNHPSARTLLNHAYHRLGRDPRVMHRAFAYLHDKLADPLLVEQHCAPLRDHIARNELAIESEELHTTFKISATSFDRVCRALEGNRARVTKLLSAGHLETRTANDLFELGTPSPAGVMVRALEVAGLESKQYSKFLLDIDRDGRVSASDRSVEVRISNRRRGARRVEFVEPLLILPAYTGLNRLQTSSLPYALHLPPGARVVEVDAINAMTGEAVATDQPLSLARVERDTLHPWDFPQTPKPQVIVLEHPVHRVEQDWIIPAHTTVHVRPGTRIEIGADVTIRAFGRIVAVGTPMEPITFTHAKAGTVWGVLALQGAGASASRFAHVKFEHGSLARFGATRYPGMVTIHRAQDVHFEHCEFSNNVKGDDLIRAAHAEVWIEDSIFHDANSDAIDFDYSTGLIARNQFAAVGNDCVDLMSSNPDIVENKIDGCGDKGISVGESSSPLIFNNLITHASIGIQLKDGSDPLVLNDTIARCDVGIHAYRKNWRYDDGGRARVYNSEIIINEVALRIEGRSQVMVTSSRIDKLDREEAPETRLTLRSSELREKGSASGVEIDADLDVYARFGPIDFTPEIGRVRKGAQLERARVLVRQRFRDGFRLDAPGWSLAGSDRLYVEGTQLKAEMKDHNSALEYSLPVTKHPENAQALITLSASGESQLQIDFVGDTTTTHLVDVDKHESPFVLPVPGSSLRSLRIRADKRVTVKVSRFDVLADSPSQALVQASEPSAASSPASAPTNQSLPHSRSRQSPQPQALPPAA